VRKPAFNCVSHIETTAEQLWDALTNSEFSKGWPAILSSLKILLETGKAMAIKTEPPKQMLEALKRLGIMTP
jgi:hypothetical protein